MIQIVEEKINIPAIIEYISHPEAGGIDIFIGATRKHSNGKEVLYLEYETYREMSLSLMENIAVQAKDKLKIEKIAIVHRVGRVDIAEASVVVAVSAVHRGEAFEASRFAIDTLKKTVPIWKKEYFTDGSKWAEG
ncbi:MAG: molybdenum cofactor biosynthesis protein MoaE [Bacteroidota bacterium]